MGTARRIVAKAPTMKNAATAFPTGLPEGCHLPEPHQAPDRQQEEDAAIGRPVVGKKDGKRELERRAPASRVADRDHRGVSQRRETHQHRHVQPLLEEERSGPVHDFPDMARQSDSASSLSTDGSRYMAASFSGVLNVATSTGRLTERALGHTVDSLVSM